jgi:hypothetical protein
VKALTPNGELSSRVVARRLNAFASDADAECVLLEAEAVEFCDPILAPRMARVVSRPAYDRGVTNVCSHNAADQKHHR